MADFIYKLPNNGVGDNGSGSQYGGNSVSSGGSAIDNSTSNSSGGGLSEQQVRDIVNSTKNTMTETRVREIVNGMQKFLTGQNIMVDGIQKSQNFATGLLGWQIDAEGNAEFNNGTFRGTFIIGGSLITVTDIANLQSAIDEVSTLGGGTVALAPDDYTATSSFTIPSGVTVDGNGSTIDFGGGAYQFLIQGTNAYSTGTITVTFGSANVVGVGTTWTAAMVGQSILLGDYWYTIATRTDNTHIALSSNFIGTNLSGDTYVIATTVDGSNLLNLTLTNSSTKLVEIRYINGMKMDSIICDIGTYGVYARDSGSLLWLNSVISNCTSGGFYGNNIPFSNLNNYFVFNITGTGIDLIRDTNAAFNTGSVQAITGVGVKMTNCVNMDYAVFSLIECTSHGVEIVSGCQGIDIIDGYINTTGGDGVKFTASNTGIQCITTSIYNTTGYGINNAASSNNSITIGINYYSSCTSGNVNNAGTGTVLIADDTAYAASWNGNMGSPTKNAVYDKIETLSSTALTLIPQPAIGNSGATIVDAAVSTNTTMIVGQVIIPFKITVNKITVFPQSNPTPGTWDLTMYSEDGQTQLFSVTTGTSATITILTTSVSSVVLNPGIYYIAINPNGTAAGNFTFWANNIIALTATGLIGGVTSEPVMSGTVTITAGTPPATITPNSIVAGGNDTLIFRLDN